MSSSAGTPGPPSNAPGQGDSKAPPAPTDSSPDKGKSSPPANSGSGNNNNNNNNKDGSGNGSSGASNNNNENNSPSESSSSPPPASPPPSQSSPPPASPPPSNKGGSGNSPPSDKSPPPKASPPPSSPPPSKASSPPPPSPPLSSSSPSESPPPPGSTPPNSSGQSSPPPPPGQSSPPPALGRSSPPPAPGQSRPALNPTDTNGNADSGGSKWSPPSQPNSPPSPASSTPGGTSSPNSNTRANPSSNVLSPSTDSESSPSIESPQDSSPASNSLSEGKTRSTRSAGSSPSTTESVDSGTIIGATVAGFFVLALIAIFFLMRGRRKKRDAYASHYMPPKNYNEKTNGYYYGQNYPMKHSGPLDTYHGSQTQPGILTNNYGSQRVNGYHGGGGGSDSGVLGGSKSFFTYEEVMEITSGFSRENVIGEGGFGCVYKGSLLDGRVVAVKQLKAGSGQGEREFRAEVEIISRVHHRHLVSLVGYCISEKNRLLIYEFVPNNNLEHHLHGKGIPVLDWSKRVKVAVGAAKGLAYLHEDCHPKIIHRDIKSANILIDDAFEAQVADFGLAKLNDTTQTHVSTRVMGTFGYLAPEYASSGKLTDRSDVFSFGVVLLELITGRKPVDASRPLGDESLVEWARPHLAHALETGDVSELVDPRLEKHYVENEMLRMIEAAAACVRHSALKRPRMIQVMRALDSEGEMSDLSNGVKYGQSTIYDSGQYNQDIMMFRKIALGFGDSSELSGEYTSRDTSRQYSGSVRSQETSNEFTSGESETRAINQNSSEQRYRGSQGCSGRWF